MTNEIAKVFSSERFGNVRVVMVDGEPWFVGKDICESLGLTNSRMSINRLDDDEKGVSSIDTLGGTQQIQVVSESGLYSLISSSRKPEAREFKRWVNHEVLPSIRKTGSYGIPQTYAATLQLAADQALMIEQQKLELTAAKPKVQFYDQVRESEQTLSMNNAAKLLGIKGLGRNKLFEQLRSRGVLDDTNVPYQRFLNSGHFEVIEKPYEYNGMVGITKVTCVTQKGLQWMSKGFSKVNR